MVFSSKNAGKWVASKNGKVVATGKKLDAVMKEVKSRKDKDSLQFDRVPEKTFFAGALGI